MAALSVILLDRSITYVSVVIIDSGLFLVRYLRRRRSPGRRTGPTPR
ncbi:MAG: hypothetical protein Q7T26_12555 [Dehalococcoidia bacterium]|nr:hypothetical protein [Dehalococcoidia bacterium]